MWRSMWRAGCLLLCLVPVTRQISITEFSVPHAVQAGEDADLLCKYELAANESDRGLYVKWWWTPLNATSDQVHQLYQRIVGLEPVTIHTTIRLELLENDGIRLLNMTPADSGTYECEVSNIDEARAHQDIIVYSMGSGPQLNFSAAEDGPDEDEDEDVVVTCAASDVAPYPDITITVDGNLLSNTSENVEGPFDGLYDIVANATVTKSTVDGAEVRCELFFKNDNISHPAYVDIETFTSSGDEPTTTDAADTATAAYVVPDPLQNINGGEKLGTCHFLVFGVLLPALSGAILL